MTDARMYLSWIGRKVVDQDGVKIGRIDEIHHDGQTGRPAWLTVHTGLFGTRTNVVPVEGARMVGDQVQIPFTKHEVKDAPNIHPGGRLNPAEEQRLFRHYAMAGNDPGQGRAQRNRPGLGAPQLRPRPGEGPPPGLRSRP